MSRNDPRAGDGGGAAGPEELLTSAGSRAGDAGEPLLEGYFLRRSRAGPEVEPPPFWPDRKAALAAASASARLATSCWVATRTGPLVDSARWVAERIREVATAETTMARLSAAAVPTDHRR